MRKLFEKVGCTLNGIVDFNAWFKSCVYNSKTPIEFETSWQSIIMDFGLANNEWLSQMLRIRELWILAYFRILG